MRFGEVFPTVMLRSIAALAIVSVGSGLYLIARAPDEVAGLFPLLVAAAFVIGFIPAVSYGAAIYALYVSEPRIPFFAVLVAAFIPGLVWVWIYQPDRNYVLWLSVGPMVALTLHALMQSKISKWNEKSES